MYFKKRKISKLYKNNKSGFAGVYFHKAANKYVARVMIDAKPMYLGLHGSAEKANEAILEYRKEQNEKVN